MELLLRVVNKDHPLAFQAGDIVVIFPDGWGWTWLERTNPEWRIVRVPFSDTDKATALLSKFDANNQLVLKRARNIDITLIPAIAASIALPRNPNEIIVLSRSDVIAALKTKS